MLLYSERAGNNLCDDLIIINMNSGWSGSCPQFRSSGGIYYVYFD